MVVFLKQYKAHSNLETLRLQDVVLWRQKKPIKRVEYVVRQIPATKTKYIENSSTGVCFNQQRNHAQNISVLVYVSHSHELISGSLDFTIKIWDLYTGLCVNTLRGHTNYIKDIVVVGSDGREEMTTTMIVSASKDRTIKVWNTKVEQCLSTLRGHSGLVNCLLVIRYDSLKKHSHHSPGLFKFLFNCFVKYLCKILSKDLKKIFKRN
jgi:WD40 repeat protein